MEARDFADQIFAQFARIGSALGHAKRVEIVDVLMQGERGVESLAQQISASVANTSRHLQVLASAGLVTRRTEGTARVYRLADQSVADAYMTLVGLAETHIAGVTALAREFFSAADNARAVSLEELDELRRNDAALLVDVRPEREFAAGHVEGAINIPLAELDDRVSELPKNRRIIAYCRGPYCVMSARAAARLRELGRDAVRLDDAYPGWRRETEPPPRVVHG